MIKNIIFDFGGVIYPINHEQSKLAFEALGLKNFETLYGHAVQTQLFENFERGMISPKYFREQIKEHLQASVSDVEIDSAWNALLLGFDSKRLELIQRIAKHYQIFLLSNTNQIHYQKYWGELQTIKDHDLFISSFKKLYFSHHIGLRKPDKKIFEFVLYDSNLSAGETAFIDDYELNIRAAKDLGIESILLENSKDLSDYFSAEGLLKPGH
jgi:putative hydrolase of the HAD superfamily